ncbi:hypothetical protein IHE49_12590 [Rhodanobacter sp. 7MK24]|uniref:hypothetical protein n=1 Tax=Rhodanobacter sp. 7MK24 TaxID=2775922 RepID=UPI001781B432|nr:hypothetical protein [Rhodanobacter sp. 7MK24]MBD8881321.1 hypothetical protein [Rhodanobacter sp. 7MK24]
MNEFEWRQQMRKLREPVAPRRDLWETIDAALEDRGESAAPQHVTRHAPPRPWLLAAALAGAFLLIGDIGLHLHRTAHDAPDNAPALASAPWKPADPRLSGAAIELDAARIELRQAMQQSPDSTSLQRLLARTEQQQTQLRHLAQEAG